MMSGTATPPMTQSLPSLLLQLQLPLFLFLISPIRLTSAPRKVEMLQEPLHRPLPTETYPCVH